MSHKVNNDRHLIEKFGFPLYIYEEKQIDKQVKILKESLPDFEIYYSMKANPNPFICEFLRSKEVGADTASVNEVMKAVNAKFSKRKILYSSPAKTEEDIRKTISHCTIVADSYNELVMINKVGKERNEKIEVGLRINPNYSIRTEDALEIMGGNPSKFGVDEETLKDKKRLIKDLEYIEITGIHVYMGSQILDYKIIYNNFEHIFKLAEFCMTTMEWELSFIDFGGGFGVPYLSDDQPLNLKVLKPMLQNLVEKQRIIRKEKVRLIVESGRFLVTEAGRFITKIIDIKESRGKKFLLIHGGMNGFFRPVFLNLRHSITLPLKNKESEKEVVSIGGNLCTPIDLLAKDILLPKAEIGDILCINNAGSYGYTMSLKEFISHTQPKEIYISKNNDIKI